MVYCNVLKLMLESADAPMAEVHHFQIYVNESGISEETFVGIVRDSTELFSWLPYRRVGDIRLCPALPPFDNPYGFDGHRGGADSFVVPGNGTSFATPRMSPLAFL
jgi:hypothetical protein